MNKEEKICILKQEGYLIDINNEEDRKMILENYELEDLESDAEYYFVGGRLYEADDDYINKLYEEISQ